MAIVIPYRSRETHLKTFLNHMHPFLTQQNLDYGIYVVEQANELHFNRAMLFNVGFVEAMKEYKWDCFIFHDVDLVPEDDRNLYTCPTTPRHMSVGKGNAMLFADNNAYCIFAFMQRRNRRNTPSGCSDQRN